MIKKMCFSCKGLRRCEVYEQNSEASIWRRSVYIHPCVALSLSSFVSSSECVHVCVCVFVVRAETLRQNIGSQHIGPDFADVLGIRLICVFLSLSQPLCCVYGVLVLCCWLPLVSARFGRCFDSVSVPSPSAVLPLALPLSLTLAFGLPHSLSLCVCRAYLLRFAFVYAFCSLWLCSRPSCCDVCLSLSL